MQKCNYFFCLAIMLAGFAACKKNDPPLQPGQPLCRITRLDRPEGATRIYYNSKGNPESVILDPGSGLGEFFNYFFRYNTRGNLTDFIMTPNVIDTGTFWTWARYKLDTHGRIIADSTWFGGIITDSIPITDLNGNTPFFRLQSSSRYTYDAKGRIIKESKVSYASSGPNDTVVTTYQYNIKGNREDHSTYDNKVNLHRTHPVWQFLDRDYSVNNNFISSSYNHYGLPKVLPDNPGKFPSYFINQVFNGPVNVTYECWP